jgi:hypothetical protein
MTYPLQLCMSLCNTPSLNQLSANFGYLDRGYIPTPLGLKMIETSKMIIFINLKTNNMKKRLNKMNILKIHVLASRVRVFLRTVIYL